MSDDPSGAEPDDAQLDAEMATIRGIQAHLDSMLDYDTEPPAEELTVAVAQGWLDTGPPSSEEMESRFGMRDDRFSIFDMDGNSRPRRRILSLVTHTLRDRYIRDVAYALPCAEAIAMIAAHGPILEVGAGAGFWAALLAREGADVIATDLCGWDFPDAKDWYGRYFPVQKLEATEAIRQYPGRTVLLNWPSMSGWPAEAVSAMPVGSVLCHVGEIHGCTGDERLYNMLAGDFETIGDYQIPTWPMIHDHLEIMRRHSIGSYPVRVAGENWRRTKRRLRKAAEAAKVGR